MNAGFEYIRMKPQDMVARRDACAVAYLPIGILEWHSLHLPLGTDALTVEGMCRACARKLGGVVFPALYWGDDRNILAETVFDPAVSAWLPEGYPDQTKAISEAYGIPTERFRQDGERYRRMEGMKLWRGMVVRIFFEIETLGFRTIFALAGHGPLEKPLIEAAGEYRAEGGAAEIFTISGMCEAAVAGAGPLPLHWPERGEPEHAAKYETSLIQYLNPELVDMGRLPEDLSVGCIGSLGGDPRTTASAELGKAMVMDIVALVRWSMGKEHP